MKTRSLFIGLLAASLLSACQTVKDASANHRAACEQIINNYAWYIDHPGDDLNATSERFAALFTEDAALTLGNLRGELVTHNGHGAIRARYKEGRDNMRFIHVTSNFRFLPQAEGNAKGVSYVQFWIHPMEGDLSQGVTGIAEYHDEYRIKDGKCKISKREGVARFLSSTNQITSPGAR